MISASRKSPLFSLPPELRLQIYEHVIRPDQQVKLVFASDSPAPSALSLLSLAPRTFGDPLTDEWVIFTRKYPAKSLRVPYRHEDGSWSEERLRVHRSRKPDVALLRVNSQIYDEALPLLWKSVVLDFTQAFSTLVPFASMLSSSARSQLNHIILRAPLHMSPWEDSWAKTCAYINAHLNLKTLTVEYRYRSGTQWTTEQWQRKFALDPHTRRPSDPAVRDALTFGNGSLISWEDVLAVDDDDFNPQGNEFLEGLPIETEDEMRRSLGIEPGRKEPLDSSLAALSKISGLETLDLKLMSGGLTPLVSEELYKSLTEKMLRRES